MSLFAGQKREYGDDDGGSSNFKKLKSDLGALFGFGSNAILQQHNTVVSFRELAILDDKACTDLVNILKTHGYYKVKEMPPEFINACTNLYTSSKGFFSQGAAFKSSRFPEKDTETGYRRTKDRETVLFRRGYQLDDPNIRGAVLDPGRDLHSRFEQYFTEATKAGNVILQAIIKGLGGSPELARNILPNSHEHNALSTNVSRAFHYFDTPLHTVICPPHIDLGLLTLVPSNFPGLQVYSLCSTCGLGWESTHKALDSTDLVVLAGEALNEYASGQLPPGLHRVVSEKPVALNFNFPFSSSFSPLSPLSPALSSPLLTSPVPPLSPSPSPPTPPAATAPPAKKSRSKKAAAKDKDKDKDNNNSNNNININNASSSYSSAASPTLNNSNGLLMSPTLQNNNSNSSSNLSSADSPNMEPTRIGRISLPFLLRPRTDAKLDGSLVGLRPGRYSEKSAGQFFEEEKMKRGGVASVGQY